MIGALITIFSSAYVEVLSRILIRFLGRYKGDDKCIHCGFLGKKLSGNPELLEVQHIEREVL